jgi:NADH-quinone oxidoreductase subunit L
MLFNEVAGVNPTFNLVPWVVFFPLIGLVLNLLFGKRLGEVFTGLVASLASAAAFGVAVLLALALTGHPEAVTVPFADWITVGNFNAGWIFRVDTLAVTMMLVVSGVGTLIHIYATRYMHSDVRHNGDPGRYRRFFVYFNLFILAMMILVSASNYLMLFVGWEGVGLCSYLLIGFWFEKGADGIGNAKAAKKAFIVNRIGDFGLLIALFIMFWAFGSLDFDAVFAKAPQVAGVMPGAILAITLFMLLGVTGKSAQLPLYVWLPDAMAGPTPVSALIHAATMVTAGVYLVARTHALYALVPAAQGAVMWVGALTAFFAATIAVGQWDIKKVLAYSTISQLGFMVAAVGMGAYVGGMFHLITHAFFKALLFLSAGSVILGMEHGHAAAHPHGEAHGDGAEAENEFDPQDMRNMGGLRSRMGVTFWVYLIGALALAGVAPLSGFFSKDEILAAASGTNSGVLVLLVAAAFFTAFYMGRQIFLVFYGKPRTEPAARAAENPPLITLPLVALALLAAVGGVLNLPGSHILETWLEPTLGTLPPAEFIVPLAGLALVLALLGLFLGWALYGRKPLATPSAPDPLSRMPVLSSIFVGMNNKWWVDELYHGLFVRSYERLASFLADPVDLGLIDKASAGLAAIVRWLARVGQYYQNGYVRSYALTVLLGVVVILMYLVLR